MNAGRSRDSSCVNEDGSTGIGGEPPGDFDTSWFAVDRPTLAPQPWARSRRRQHPRSCTRTQDHESRAGMGRPEISLDGLRARRYRWPPLRLCREDESVCVVLARPVSQRVEDRRAFDRTLLTRLRRATPELVQPSSYCACFGDIGRLALDPGKDGASVVTVANAVLAVLLTREPQHRARQQGDAERQRELHDDESSVLQRTRLDAAATGTHTDGEIAAPAHQQGCTGRRCGANISIRPRVANGHDN